MKLYQFILLVDRCFVLVFGRIFMVPYMFADMDDLTSSFPMFFPLLTFSGCQESSPVFTRGEYSHTHLFPGIGGKSFNFSHWSQYERQASHIRSYFILLRYIFLCVVCGGIFKYCWILSDYFLHLLKCPHFIHFC